MHGRTLVAALAATLAAAALPATATAQPAPRHPGSRVVGSVAPDQRLHLTFELAPRNRALLADLAAHASGAAPLGPQELRRLFAPLPARRRQVAAYLRQQGMRIQGHGLLTLSASAPAAAAERMFGVRLARFSQRGQTFHAPTATPRMPMMLAGRVLAVQGLDTSPMARPATAAPQAVSAGASCPGSGPDAYQSGHSGYQPAELATAYDFQQLIDQGGDGSNEAIAFVELANYDHDDIAAYKSCYGLSQPIYDHSVGGGTSSLNGSIEVQLDLEVALAASPNLRRADVYMAPNAGDPFPAIMDRIVRDQVNTGVHVVSISWGLCEAYSDPRDLAVENLEFQLAALSGISIYAASGDSGSTDCLPYGTRLLDVDDPASQPYVTGVGGTTLDTSSQSETAWNDTNDGYQSGGGGGVSRIWPMPSWQKGSGVVESGSSGSKCGLAAGHYCREVPDVALDADPDTGYVVYCTTPDCNGAGWLTVGGTSAAAPLMAAITADANTYALTQPNGGRLGFASPFLYGRFAAGSSMLNDIVSGSNNVLGGLSYQAGPGYDMATGLGSIDGWQMAQDLTSVGATAATTDAARLSAGSSRASVTYGGRVTFSGRLLNHANGRGLVGQTVWVFANQGDPYDVAWRVRTDSDGRWHLTLSTAIKRKFNWSAWYVGAYGEEPVATSTRVVRVIPKLSASASLHRRRGHYVVRHGTRFTFRGSSKPNMAGRRMALQYRFAGARRWHTLGRVTVSRTGAFGARGIRFAGAGKAYFRWSYAGSRTGRWLSATSHPLLVVAS